MRQALNLRPGERIRFDVEAGEVRMRRAEPMDADFARAVGGTLSEWASAEDEAAFADL